MARPRRLTGAVKTEVGDKSKHHIKDALPWSKEIKDKVEELYYKHLPAPQISEETGVPVATVRSWATNGKWTVKRNLAQKELIHEITEKKRGHLIRITDMCVEGLERVIETKLRSRDLDMQDAKFFASIVGDLENIFRLSNNQPTSISENRQLTANVNLTDKKNIMKIIQGDPMVELALEHDEEPKKVEVLEADDEFDDNPTT
jgi:hypothetical protein